MTTTTCPGCHGAGTEMSGTTHAGLAEHLACDECGPECPDDCGCRASDATERPESIAPRHPGATQSPSGYPSDPPALNGPQNRAERCEPVDVTEEEMREFIVACDGPQGVSDEEAAEWERLAAGATEGPWVVDPDGSIGAPMAGFVCGEDGHPRLDCSECGTRVCHVNVIPGDPDAAFIAAAWAAVPRLLADRDRLKGERDRAIGFATRVEAENARMVEWNAIATRAFETTRRVLQEASGLPDDIDDPDCRDEMVLALRPRAEKAEAEVEQLRQSRDTWERVEAETRAEMHTRLAEHRDAVEVLKLRLSEVAAERDRARGTAVALEAENARMREGIERLCSDIDNPLRERHDESPHDLPEVAEDLRALLADTDGAKDEGGDRG